MAAHATIKISKADWPRPRVVTKATPTTTSDALDARAAALKKMNKKLIDLLDLDAAIKNNVKTKIGNIAGKAKVSPLCGGARIAKKSRFTLPYSDLTRNAITLENLMTISNGVVVVLENEDYFNILKSSSPLDQYLLENIGGNKTVSAIVAFYSVGGTSSSAAAMAIYEKMESIIVEKKWLPIERTSEPIPHGKTYIDNDKWEGQYYANIRGGSNKKKVQTHCKVGSSLPAKFQLFNSVGGYMDSTVGIHLTSSMLYMLLFSH